MLNTHLPRMHGQFWATMNTTTAPFRVGQTLIGPLFNEPMRVETVAPAGAASWALGLVGAQSERFRRVTMAEADIASITILDAEMAFNGDGTLLRWYLADVA